MKIAVLACGDRNATPAVWEPVITKAFITLHPHANDVTLIHGAARGIDAIAGLVFMRLWPQHPIELFPADWDTHGRAAGPIRNEAMLRRLLALRDEGYRVGVMAFHDDLEHSKGTGGMVRLAEAADVTVVRVRSGG